MKVKARISRGTKGPNRKSEKREGMGWVIYLTYNIDLYESTLCETEPWKMNAHNKDLKNP